MQDITQLAYGQIANHDQLVIQLLRQEDQPTAERTLTPAAVRIIWPSAPTIVSARQFPDVAALAVRTLSGAAVELSRIQAMKKGLR